MTDNDVISIVVRNVKNKYPDLDVEKEDVKQGANLPFFYVYIIQSSREKQVGRKYKQSFQMAVKYYSKSETAAECFDTASGLWDVFKLMEFNNKVVKAKNLEYKVIEGVLHFYFDIENIELESTDVSKFGNLEVNIDVK